MLKHLSAEEKRLKLDETSKTKQFCICISHFALMFMSSFHRIVDFATLVYMLNKCSVWLRNRKENKNGKDRHA